MNKEAVFLQTIMKKIKSFMKDEDGLTTAEWVILGSAIAIAAMAILGLIIPKIKELAGKVGDRIGGYDMDDPK